MYALSRPTKAEGSALLHSCPVDPDCPYCRGSVAAQAFEWPLIDAVYCISLASRPDRAASASSFLHALGLCSIAIFYRPHKHPTAPKIGIWDSHREVAMDAIERGFRNVLIIEDDVRLVRRVAPATVRAVNQAMASLPEDWMIFFLGHWPVRARPLGRHVLRTASGCAHAYIASPRLLAWLAAHPYGTAPTMPLVGGGLDAAYAVLPGCYAYFPMLIAQSSSPSDHIVYDPSRPIRRLRHLISRVPWREKLQSHLMRPTEFAVVLLWPVLALIDRMKPLAIRPPRRVLPRSPSRISSTEASR